MTQEFFAAIKNPCHAGKKVCPLASAQSSMSKAGAITNSERKDRSIRLWGGAEPSAATQPPLPARARVSPPCVCRLPGPVDEPWAQSEGSWRWSRATCVS